MSLSKLPAEIRDSILQKCTHKAHLNLRLVNKHVCNLATPFAFATIYVGWLPEYFKKLQLIAASHLSKHVRAMHVELDLLNPDAPDPDPSQIPPNTTFYEQIDILTNSVRERHRLLTLQSMYMRPLWDDELIGTVQGWQPEECSEQFRRAICACVPQFANLTHIKPVSSGSLQSWFEQTAVDECKVENHMRQDEDHQYLRLMRYFNNLITTEPYLREDRRHKTFRIWSMRWWLLAVAQCRNRTTTFDLLSSGWATEAPGEINSQDGLSSHALAIRAFANLECLELNLMDLGAYQPDVESQARLAKFAAHINHAVQLKHLCIEWLATAPIFGRVAETQGGAERFLTTGNQTEFWQILHLPHLERLETSALSGQASMFITFMQRHSATLRHYKSRHSWLGSDEDEGSSIWKTTLEQLAGKLQLESVDLGFMLDANLLAHLEGQFEPGTRCENHEWGVVWRGQKKYSARASRFLRRRGSCEYPGLELVELWRKCAGPCTYPSSENKYDDNDDRETSESESEAEADRIGPES